MKENKSGWQFPKALEIIKCKEGNKEFMKERPARRPFGNTVLICEYPIDDTAAEEPNAKLITWRLAKRSRFNGSLKNTIASPQGSEWLYPPRLFPTQ